MDIETFITRWKENSGGAERANFPLFLTELCDIIGVEKPEPASTDTQNNSYVFERAVTFKEAGDRVGNGRIDLYKKGSFVLEAKQSIKRSGQKKLDNHDDLFKAEDDKGSSRRADRKWDVLMVNARRQAEDYAKALPAADGWPPFILVCDVGYCIEVYADFSGQGKNYSQFPDRRGYRIYLEDLRDEEVRERLKAIWEEPKSLDPTARAVKASREIAKRLAQVSKSLEAAEHDPEEVAAFLMRCLFTMFAEDMALLPEDSFKEMLRGCENKPDNFVPMVSQLWQAMDKGDFAYGIAAKVRRFNGNLFANSKVFELAKEEIGELRHAAEADWTEVDPSIFGTLLEQALSPSDRSKLGAHYTPRAYVERLVIATIMEPLQEDWRNVRSTAERLH
ncbi:MAG: type IIL restriction-modification enzyme MmeI, partial [Pseudomonadota bacterium]